MYIYVYMYSDYYDYYNLRRIAKSECKCNRELLMQCDLCLY